MSTLSQYLELKQKTDTAKEVNEQSQAVYRKDLIYLFFKMLLFAVLVGVYMLFRPKVITTLANIPKVDKVSKVEKVIPKV
jgi:hypothetical protein